MNQIRTVSQIQKVGLIPVPIETVRSPKDMAQFAGVLGQFLATSKAIGATVIFVENVPLKDWHFSYNPMKVKDRRMQTLIQTMRSI